MRDIKTHTVSSNKHPLNLIIGLVHSQRMLKRIVFVASEKPDGELLVMYCSVYVMLDATIFTGALIKNEFMITVGGKTGHVTCMRRYYRTNFNSVSIDCGKMFVLMGC